MTTRAKLQRAEGVLEEFEATRRSLRAAANPEVEPGNKALGAKRKKMSHAEMLKHTSKKR